MQSLSHISPTKFRLALSSSLLRYSTSSPSFHPTLATVSTTQPKLSQSKPAHEWQESTATLSEADVSSNTQNSSSSTSPISLLPPLPLSFLLSTIPPTNHPTQPSLTPTQVKADRDAITAELHSAKVEREIAAFGETGWKKADWAD